ncbi:hypothetical protein E2C01_087813 [Portunus trituberculatus]|uniref:Uncharacterized protein n=1 Tax=Portunus trituberculatus TaxID=210409 RepID=A0A5B7JI99_PORTR|nr:hypothetical protein [Portunus trituberculatus]
MTLGQSSPQVGGREVGHLCREIPFSGGDVRPGLQDPGNTGKVLCEKVGDSPRVCHRSPRR